MASVKLNNTLQEDWVAQPDSGQQWSHCAVVPLYIAIQGLAGIRPLLPGFARAELRPQLADLHDLGLTAHTVRGPVPLRRPRPHGPSRAHGRAASRLPGRNRPAPRRDREPAASRRTRAHRSLPVPASRQANHLEFEIDMNTISSSSFALRHGKGRACLVLSLAVLFVHHDASAFEGELVISAYQGVCKEGDFTANLATVRHAIGVAKERGSHFVVFPDAS